MARTICPRCAAPLRRAADCGRCGPVVAGVLDPIPPRPGAEPWPVARRWLDDIRPGRDRRPLVLAACCVAAALLIGALAVF